MICNIIWIYDSLSMFQFECFEESCKAQCAMRTLNSLCKWIVPYSRYQIQLSQSHFAIEHTSVLIEREKSMSIECAESLRL